MLPVLPLHRFARLGLCALALLTLGPWAAAAPAVSPAPSEAPPVEAVGEPRDMPSMSEAEIGDQSRTIKLLLELQAVPDAVATSETRQRGARPAAKASDAKAAANPLIDPDGPFGAPAVAGPASAGGAAAVDWHGELGAVATPAALGGRAVSPTYEPYGSARSDGGSRSEGGRTVRLLPPELMQWLREHRAAIIGGAVVLLVLLSLGAAVSSQRQR